MSALADRVEELRDRLERETPRDLPNDLHRRFPLQHRLAEMAITLAAIDAGLAGAVTPAEGPEPGRTARVHTLHACAAGLARELVESGLQVHGGAGFTAGHRLHAYLKRAPRLQAVAEAQGDPLAAMGGRLLAGSAGPGRAGRGGRRPV
jgi:alkylation response protein AidB-like acyl-CoA dehydrogenase